VAQGPNITGSNMVVFRMNIENENHMKKRKKIVNWKTRIWTHSKVSWRSESSEI